MEVHYSTRISISRVERRNLARSSSGMTPPTIQQVRNLKKLQSNTLGEVDRRPAQFRRSLLDQRSRHAPPRLLPAI